MTDGRVPRHSVCTGFGPRRMALTVCGRETCGEDCCKRVLSRSAGWRRKAARAPEERPEAKWERCDGRLDVIVVVVVVVAVVVLSVVVGVVVGGAEEEVTVVSGMVYGMRQIRVAQTTTTT